MIDNVVLYLLIAAYLRKGNHPEETDADIMAGVVVDIQKINTALNEMDLSEIAR